MNDEKNAFDNLVTDILDRNKSKNKIAKAKASEIVKELKIENPPILIKDVVKLLRKRINSRFYIKKLPLKKGFSGQIIIGSSVIGIIYNSNDNEYRQRFTVAHELGHLVLKHSIKVKTYKEMINFNSSKSIEREANIFAAELIMPKKLLKTYYYGSAMGNISKLSTAFRVSKKALWFKLYNDKIV